MPKLNINSFNEVLLQFCEDNDSRIELLENELEMVSAILWDEIANLLQELEDTNYNSMQFTKIQTIKNNSECIIEKLEELKGGADYGKEKDPAGRCRAEQTAKTGQQKRADTDNQSKCDLSGTDARGSAAPSPDSGKADRNHRTL